MANLVCLKQSVTSTLLFFSMLLCIGKAAYAQHPEAEVFYYGALKNFMQKADVSAKVKLDTLQSIPHLYALGAMEGLQGEVQIFDGHAYHSVKDGTRVRIDTSFAQKASLLVAAPVSNWQSVALPDSVQTYQQLEQFIKQLIANTHLADTPFPFKITGTVKLLNWHVIDWAEGDSVHTHQKHKTAGLTGTIAQTRVNIIGFYSTKHKGIFTHQTSAMHLHFSTQDGVLAGHIDDVQLGNGMEMSLPDTSIFMKIHNAVVAYANWIWGTPLLILLMGGGLFFVVYSRFIPYRYFWHAINVLRGKYDTPGEEGEINHYEALSTALAATVGMGNVSGVAVAITMGGPGAIFWMWMSAIVGMVTKYFTITLAVMYRGKDDSGTPQGGPMYVIQEGMGKKWRPLGVFFSLTAMVGVLPIFQANQLTKVIRDVVLVPNHWDQGATSNWIIGVSLMAIVAFVIFGGIKRIAQIAGKLVPLMVVVYFLSVFYIILTNWAVVPKSMWLILTDAFTAKSVLGGAVGTIIIIGAKRAAFSNEAGIGTAPMVQGQAKTNEPVREGLVGMLGPAIDTLVVCTLTALAIIVTGAWQEQGVDGITVTVHAFNTAIPYIGSYLLFLAVLIFAITSLFSLSYYGEKSLAFLIGTHKAHLYRVVYVLSIVLGAVASLNFIINVIDSFYAMMAIPTMISALWLAPKVMQETKRYFAKMKDEGKL